MDAVNIFGYLFGAGAALVFAAAGFTLGRVQRELHNRKSVRANLARANDRTQQRANAVRHLVTIPDDDDDHGTGPEPESEFFADSRGDLHRVHDDDSGDGGPRRRAVHGTHHRVSNPGYVGRRVLGGTNETSVAV